MPTNPRNTPNVAKNPPFCFRILIQIKATIPVKKAADDKADEI
jgi:hypothetical protein